MKLGEMIVSVNKNESEEQWLIWFHDNPTMRRLSDGWVSESDAIHHWS